MSATPSSAPPPPMKGGVVPEYVAGPVLFFCSPAAVFVTGVILPVDGGYQLVR